MKKCLYLFTFTRLSMVQSLVNTFLRLMCKSSLQWLIFRSFASILMLSHLWRDLWIEIRHIFYLQHFIIRVYNFSFLVCWVVFYFKLILSSQWLVSFLIWFIDILKTFWLLIVPAVELVAFIFILTRSFCNLLIRILIADICTIGIAGLPTIRLLHLLKLLYIELVHLVVR